MLLLASSPFVPHACHRSHEGASQRKMNGFVKIPARCWVRFVPALGEIVRCQVNPRLSACLPSGCDLCNHGFGGNTSSGKRLNILFHCGTSPCDATSVVRDIDWIVVYVPITSMEQQYRCHAQADIEQKDPGNRRRRRMCLLLRLRGLTVGSTGSCCQFAGPVRRGSPWISEYE